MISVSELSTTTEQRRNPHLSVIIPAFNEAERILPTIDAINAHLSTRDLEWELVVADDGSSDETVSLVSALPLRNLRILLAPRNGGKGSAVRRGILAARGRYILFTDADNATPIEEVGKLLQRVRDAGFDIAIGSRAAAGATESNRSLLRRTSSAGLRWLIQLGLRLDVQDTQCGFKLYRKEVALKLSAMQTLMGFSFDLEHLYLARKAGYRVAEVPVRWTAVEGSKVSVARVIPQFLRDIVRLKLNDFKGIYHELQRDASGGRRHHVSSWKRLSQRVRFSFR